MYRITEMFLDKASKSNLYESEEDLDNQVLLLEAKCAKFIIEYWHEDIWILHPNSLMRFINNEKLILKIHEQVSINLS